MRSILFLCGTTIAFILSACNPKDDSFKPGPNEKKFDSLINIIADPNSTANKNWNNPTRDQVYDTIFKTLTEPVPLATGRRIVDNGKNAYYFGAKKLDNPEVMIPVSELVTKIFPPGEVADYENYGLRVYPILKTKDNVQYLAYGVCRSTNYDVKLEKAYYIIENNGGGYKFTLSTKNEVKGLFQEFVTKVSIGGSIRKSDDPVYRSSRYYDWTGLMTYFEANDCVSPYTNYTIKLSYGYTNSSDATELYKIYYKRVAEKAENLQGFTVVWELYKDGSSVVTDPTVQLGFWKNLIEIGNPCPPRCKGEGLFYVE